MGIFWGGRRPGISIPLLERRMNILGFLIPDDPANVAGMVAGTVGNKAIETTGNQIKFDNFVQQAKDKGVLTKTDDCKAEQNGTLGIYNAYEELYAYLKYKKIIKSTAEAASIMTFETVDTINKDLIKESDIKRLVNKDNKDFPTSLKCYSIKHDKLSDLLEHYKYSATNEFKVIGGLVSGKRRNTKRRRNTRRRTQKRRN